MDILVGLAQLVAGFALLVKGADFFVEGADSLARRLGVPPLVVGLTVVALGTSAPEAAISISSGLKDAAGIAIGNILGSNMMNVLVVLGLAAVIAEVPVQRSTYKLEIPFTLLITVMLIVMGIRGEVLGWADATVMLVLFAIYMGYTVYLGMKDTADEEAEDEEGRPILRKRIITLYLIGGAAAIIIGSDFVVDGGTLVAQLLGVSDRVIGLTIVALGTSLPELMTSVTAARRGDADIAIGGVVGSNIFNLLFVLGLSSALNPIPFGREFILDGVLAASSLILLWLALSRTRSLRRVGGAVMLAAYALYLGYLLMGQF